MIIVQIGTDSRTPYNCISKVLFDEKKLEIKIGDRVQYLDLNNSGDRLMQVFVDEAGELYLIRDSELTEADRVALLKQQKKCMALFSVHYPTPEAAWGDRGVFAAQYMRWGTESGRTPADYHRGAWTDEGEPVTSEIFDRFPRENVGFVGLEVFGNGLEVY